MRPRQEDSEVLQAGHVVPFFGGQTLPGSEV